MAYSPIAFTAANYRDYKFNWLKAYEPGTTTPKVIATDSTLGTLIAKAQINVDGFIISAGEALITPYVDGSYDLWLFPTAAEADANDTSSALRLADNITGLSGAIASGDAAVTSAFIAADVVVTDAFIAADVVVTDAFIAADTAAASYLAADTGASLVGSSSGSTVQQEITALQAGQAGGVIVFATYALLGAYTPAVDEQNTSFKVTNDNDTSLNGYYSWVSGTTYTKDASLVVNVIDAANTSDAVSGAAVANKINDELINIPKSFPSNNTVSYNTKDFGTLLDVGGTLGSFSYINEEAHVLYEATLKEVELKTTGVGTANIQVWKRTSEAPLTLELLYTYGLLNVVGGTNTYVIEDAYVIEADTFIGIQCAVLYFNANDYTQESMTSTPTSPFEANKVFARVSANYTFDSGQVILGLLDKASADLLYPPKSVFPVEVDTSVESHYPTPNYNTMALTGGTLGLNYYAVPEALTTQTGVLKDVSIRATGNGVANIAVFKIVSDNGGGDYTVEGVHYYDPIAVVAGDNTYTISDNFVIPADHYIAVNCSVMYYDSVEGTIDTLRVAVDTPTVGAYTKVVVAANYSLYGLKVSSEILTKTTADELYQPIVSTSSVTPYQITPPTRKLNLTASSKILLYGDSISSTNFPWYKEHMEEITGALVYNGGFSGETAAMTAGNTDMQRIFDYDGDVIVCLIGGNDSGAATSVGTFDGSTVGEPIVTETDVDVDYNGTKFIQAISHTMRKIQKYYYNIRERANLTGSETEAERTAKIDAVSKPYLIFVTPTRQNKDNSAHVNSQPENWQRKRDAVVECCIKYNVTCVDLFNSFVPDMSLEIFWTVPSDGTNYGVYYLDGLHPNKYGFRIIAESVCAVLD